VPGGQLAGATLDAPGLHASQPGLSLNISLVERSGGSRQLGQAEASAELIGSKLVRANVSSATTSVVAGA